MSVATTALVQKSTRAPDIKTLKPCVIKFGSPDDVTRKAGLSGSNLNYIPGHRAMSNPFECDDQQAHRSMSVKMPVFVQQLLLVLHARVTTDILPMRCSTCTYTEHNIPHGWCKARWMDYQGHLFLGDFGSCMSNITHHLIMRGYYDGVMALW